MEGLQASFTRSEWFVTSTFNTGAFGFKKGANAVAFNVMTFSPGDLEERTIYRPRGTGRMLDLGTVALGMAYARQFTDKLSFGIRIAWVRENLDLVDYSTVNFDFGTTFRTGFRSIRLGMSMQNFGRDVSVFRRQFQQPVLFNLGGAGEIYGAQGDPMFVTAAFQMSYAVSYEERYHLGGEAWIMNILALRAGYMINYDTLGMTAGAGVSVPLVGRKLTADIAWQEGRNDMNRPLRISVGLKL